MGIDTESSKEYEKTWNEKIRFKGISQEELDRIAAQDKEIADSQEEVNRHVKAAVEDPNLNVFDKEKSAKIEAGKQKKLDSYK